MKCNIVKGTIGKNSKDFFLCTTHKQFLNEEPACTCGYKETEDFDRGNVVECE